jgi:MFS family permease
MQLVLDASALQAAVWFIPMIAGGLFLSSICGYVLHRLPGTMLLVISGLGHVASVLFFALAPPHPNYWAFIFPAMIGATVGIDITFVVSNIFITKSLPQHQQGVAGALINSLLFLGISFFLGVADIVVAAVEKSRKGDVDLRKSYQAAFWFGVACAGVAIASVIFTRIGKAKAHGETTVTDVETVNSGTPGNKAEG